MFDSYSIIQKGGRLHVCRVKLNKSLSEKYSDLQRGETAGDLGNGHTANRSFNSPNTCEILNNHYDRMAFRNVGQIYVRNYVLKRILFHGH